MQRESPNEPRSAPTEERGYTRAHKHYEFWFHGDGVKTEYQLSKTFERVEDVEVFVDELKKRPASKGTNHDFQLRGLTAGYSGDRNTVKFTVAPPNGDNVCIRVTSA